MCAVEYVCFCIYSTDTTDLGCNFHISTKNINNKYFGSILGHFPTFLFALHENRR